MIAREGNSSSLWKILEPHIQWLFLIRVIMKIGTMRLLAFISMKAFFNFEELWVIFLFFPAMRKLALVILGTPVLIRLDKSFCLPVIAQFRSIGVEVRLSSVILPVMSIDTNISFMIIFSIRTPHSLKMINIEIHIRDKLFY